VVLVVKERPDDLLLDRFFLVTCLTLQCAIRRIRSSIPITSGHALRSSDHRATSPLSVVW
jgi:hypothetical protein